MSQTLLKERTTEIRVSKTLSARLAKVAKIAGFQSAEDYANYLLGSLVQEIESPTKLRPRWAGDSDEVAEISLEELETIKNEMDSLIQLSC
jgi:hypothetical protein